jgi:hypothetical protein
MPRDIIVPFGDTHCGSTLGLCTPRVVLSDEGEYRASKAQLALHKYWLSIWGEILASLGKDDRLHVIANGDLVDGDHHNTPQIFTRRDVDQANIIIDLLTPIRNQAEQLYIIAGTTSHVGIDAERYIAQELAAYDKTVLPKLELEVQGIRFRFAHHGPNPGTREHTIGDGIRRELRNEYLQALRHGVDPAHYYIWSHYHQSPPAETITMMHNGNEHTMTGVVLPAWQLCTEYAHRVQKGASISHIGMRWFEVVDGAVTMHSRIDIRDETRRVRA